MSASSRADKRYAAEVAWSNAYDVSCRNQTPEEVAIISEESLMVNRAIESELPSLHRRVIDGRRLDTTFVDIGKEFNLSRERMRQVYANAIARVARRVNGPEMTKEVTKVSTVRLTPQARKYDEQNVIRLHNGGIEWTGQYLNQLGEWEEASRWHGPTDITTSSVLLNASADWLDSSIKRHNDSAEKRLKIASPDYIWGPVRSAELADIEEAIHMFLEEQLNGHRRIVRHKDKLLNIVLTVDVVKEGLTK